MLLNKKISLVIPCKNEEAALYSMLCKLPSYVDEVIVVDNNSKDNTRKVAKRAGAKVIKEKRHVQGVGYGYACQTGIKKATGDIIITMDGDDTYPLDAIKETVMYLEKNKFDFVSCARFPLVQPHAISFLRQFGVKFLNLEVSILYRRRIKDILSGMWVIRRDCVDKLTIKNGDWNFSPEIKLEALSNPEINFSEYHISHSIRLNGFSKQNIWKTGFSHLTYILKRRLTQDQKITLQIPIALNQTRILAKNLLAVLF